MTVSRTNTNHDSHFHDVRRAPAMAPLAIVSGMRENLISPNVGGGRGSSSELSPADRVCLCLTY